MTRAFDAFVLPSDKEAESASGAHPGDPECRTNLRRPPRASADPVADHCPRDLITYRVSVLAQVLSRVVDACVRRNLRLTISQWRLLVVLNRLGTSPSGELARMSNLNDSQVSRAAFELSNMGLVTQVSDAADRRKKNLALTPAAMECLRGGVPVSVAREARLRSRLTAADYAAFIRALDALEDEAQTMLMEIRNEK